MTVVKGGVYKNQEGLEFKVVKIKSENDICIKFLKTGYECRARLHLVESGNVRDYTEIQSNRAAWKACDETYVTNYGETLHVFAKKGNKRKARFQDGFVIEAYDANIKAGKVLNPFSISRYGVGYIGLPDTTLPYYKQAKQLWSNMLKRCYSTKDERGYQGKAFVDERWKSFENFLNDLKFLDGFSDWIKGHSNPYYKSNLDKDFYIEGNDTYSRFYCCFLPDGYNKSLGKKDKTEKDWA